MTLEAYVCETVELIVNASDSFLNSFLESSTDTHNFTDALHAATEERAHSTKLLEVPARDLDHDIVQARLEARRRHLRHRVLDLVQRDAEPELRRDERERVARRL